MKFVEYSTAIEISSGPQKFFGDAKWVEKYSPQRIYPYFQNQKRYTPKIKNYVKKRDF